MSEITTLRRNVLQKYAYNRVFVETGTYLGGGVDIALACGFKKIHTIEVHAPYYEAQKKRFEGTSVVFWLGDSGKKLQEVIWNIDEPITFWLDGHAHGAGKADKETPIIEELAIIAQHPIKTHTLLIDDRRVMGTSYWGGVTEQQVIAGIMNINPNYKLSYEDATISNDILVATI